MAKIKGRCTNIGKPCSKAVNKEILEVEDTDFICPECGKPLIKVQGGASVGQGAHGASRQRGGNKGGLGKLIGIIVAAIVVIGGVLAVILSISDDKEVVEEPVEVVTEETNGTPEGVADTTVAEPVNTPVTEPVDTPETKPAEPTDIKSENPEAPKTVFGGAATIKGNVITFNRAYRMKVRTVDGDYIDIPAGAKIITAKFDGNYLIQGELMIGNESRLLTGIKEKLR